MDNRQRKRTTAEALRGAVRKDDFRKSMASGDVPIPTDKRFEELLKRLHEAEEPEGVGETLTFRIAFVLAAIPLQPVPLVKAE